jgi:ABC-2 type transport system permease protein
MSARRCWLIASADLAEAARRPLFWLWAALMGGNAWLMSRGVWIYRSVDTSLGSPRAWANSEFQIGFVLPLLSFLLVSFFVAVAAGMPLIRDRERRVDAILAATPLTAGEYVWGKFLAALGACLAVMAVFLGILVVFVHGLPDAANPDIYGPWSALAYLRPMLLMMLPGLVFVAGAAFLIGEATGKPIVVFLLPVVLLPFLQNFVWRWFPADLGPVTGALLRYLDPSGFRWLKETWLRVDRGIEFYNTRPIPYDAAFVVSRVAMVLCGLLLVDVARRHLRPRGGRRDLPERTGRVAAAAVGGGGLPEAGKQSAAAEGDREIAALAMRSRPPGFLAGALAVTRFELAELVSQPGLYIFLPALLLLLKIDFDAGQAPGPFGASVLLTPGTAAVLALFVLTPWLCLLLMFYTVESIQRDRGTRLAPLVYATPVSTPSLLAGKALANGALVAISLAASFLVAALTMLSQGKVHLALWPFVLVWGLLLPPTLLLWTAFVTAVLAWTDNRYVTYGIALAALVATLGAFLRGAMNWVGNWPLIDAVRWSDMGTFELDRQALWLNRLEVLSAVPLLAYLAVRSFRRREGDKLAAGGGGAERRTGAGSLPPSVPVAKASAVRGRFPWDASPQGTQGGRDPALRRPALWLAGLAAPPLIFGLALWFAVQQGFEGGAAERRHKDYWRQNLATWIDAPLPYVTHVDLDLDLEPARRWFRVRGSYDLVNRRAAPIPWFPVTGGIGWRDLAWTFDGKPYQPEERETRTGMFVFRQAMAPGAPHRLGFSYQAVLLPGISRNGGGLPTPSEFILPSSVIVNGRNPDFVPVLGFRQDIGIDDDNRYERRRFPPDFWQAELDAELDRSAFTSRMRITAPTEYTVNSTGALTGETLRGGRRTWTWESDYPLRVINVAAGRWAVRRGHGTAVYYDPRHPYNVDSILAALDGARRWYAEWFGPYPWRELRLNEFPAIAGYGQGNATNIFFSEAVGFLALPTPTSDPAFAVTAHEAAHQWWGHILAAGDGPGGIILAEGAANFSTMLLLDQVRGPAARIDFATRSEAFYGEFRQPGDEKPLAETFGARPADGTVIYDKGGWAFWMLLQQMGREAYFAGARHFIAQYHDAPGHPVLQHFVAAMRPYAPDPAGFDEVADQWFFKVVMPEYRIVEARKRRLDGAGPGGTGTGAGVGGAGVGRGAEVGVAGVGRGAEAETWEVVARIANPGTARMPVEVAAARRRERFGDDGKETAGYRDVRATLLLGPGEEKQVRLVCPFDPQRLVVDPDAKVLQLQRKAASVRL